jgi:hypothetical protein
MERSVEAVYGLGRLVFGGSLMAAPEQLGRLLVGDEAEIPAVRIGLRTYGTRDTVLGLGTLRAVAGRGEVAPWLVAGVASDLLDAAVQLREWGNLPSDKRLPGTAMALSAAGVGAALLVRRSAKAS